MKLQKQFDLAMKSLPQYDCRSIFRDMCRMGAISIANSVFPASLWKKREEEYMSIVKNYPESDLKRIVDLYCLLTAEITNNPYTDILGKLYTVNEIGNRRLGQFFTPIGVSLMMANIILGDYDEAIHEKGFVSVYDCCSGAGGLLLSTAKAIAERGDDPSKIAIFVGQDVDRCCADMTVIQMYYNNLSAAVQRGDSLSQKFSDTIYTPQWLTSGLGAKFDEDQQKKNVMEAANE